MNRKKKRKLEERKQKNKTKKKSFMGSPSCKYMAQKLVRQVQYNRWFYVLTVCTKGWNNVLFNTERDTIDWDITRSQSPAT